MDTKELKPIKIEINTNPVKPPQKTNVSDEASKLASRARRELRESGEVKTICPKCHQKVQIKKEENRISIFCPCHYVSDHEISF